MSKGHIREQSLTSEPRTKQHPIHMWFIPFTCPSHPPIQISPLTNYKPQFCVGVGIARVLSPPIPLTFVWEASFCP